MAEVEPLSDDVGFLLSRAAAQMLSAVNDALTPVGLRVRSYSVLVLACETRSGVNQRQVAATLGLDPSQIVALVDELEAGGLVARALDPVDRRNKLIAATRDGRRLRIEARALVDQAHSEYLGALPEDFVDRMRDALQQIVFRGQGGTG